MLASYPAFAEINITKQNNKTLLSSCQTFNSDPEHIDVAPCVYYIHGLLDGALDANKVIAADSNNRRENSQSLTWSERAYRYRAGSLANRGKPATITYYCSLDNELHMAVIEEMAKQPLQRVNSIQGIQGWVFDALKTICPEFVENP